MRRVLVFFEARSRDASTKRYFKLPFEWSATQPKGTTTAVPIETNNGAFLLEGVVTDVRDQEAPGRVLFSTQNLVAEEMEGAILPGGSRLQTVETWLK